MNFCTLFDKDFNALGSWTQHVVSTYKLTKRAYDYDDLSVVCQGFENSKNACYVVLYDSWGVAKYVAFSGIPTTDKDGLTTIKGSDCRCLFNQEIPLDFSIKEGSNYKYNTLGGIYTYLLKDCLEEYDIMIDYEIDVSEAEGIAWDESKISRTLEIRNLYETIQAVNNLYDCIVIPEIKVNDEGRYFLQFTVKRLTNMCYIRLSDYDTNISIGSNFVNRVVCKGEAQTRSLYINKFNEITTLNADALIPPRIKVIEADTFEEAVTQGYEELSNNLYKDRVKINLNTKFGSRLKNVDLTYKGEFSDYYGADSDMTKVLPVYAVSEDNNGNKSIEFGRLSTYWFLDN